MEVMTDKATMEVPSRFAGRIGELHAEPGQQIKVGQVVLTYEAGMVTGRQGGEETEGNGLAKRGDEPRAVVATPVRGSSLAAIKAAPSVRQMARKLGIDLAGVRGSGPEGRILVEDLTKQVQETTTARPQAKEETKADYGMPGARIKLVGVRRKIAEHMALSKRTIPHYSYVDECDVTELVRVRESLKETYAQAGIKLTYLAFAVKAAVGALKEVPLVNATLDEEMGEIVLHDHYDIGIAVATPVGLIVPVVRQAD